MAIILQLLPRNHNPLLVFLGITPCRIIFSEVQHKSSLPLVTVSQVDQLLKNSVEAGICTSNEAGEIRAQVVAAGLPIDARALVTYTLNHQVEGELGELSFRVCGHELPRLPHGRYFRGEVQLTEQIDTVVGAFGAVQELLAEDCTPQQAVMLLRQASLVGLPIDEECIRDIMAEIPEGTKLVCQQRREEFTLEDLSRRLSHVDLSAMGRVLAELGVGNHSET